ncbi:MAG: sensor histidine kinase [Actinomycetota bacterium]|nr:sensor histidine kinase [Actinomycetota bacterium]
MTSNLVASVRRLSAYGARLAWSLWTLAVMLVFCSVFLLAVNLTAADEAGLGYWPNNVVAAVALSTVGALVASWRRENVIGWLFGIAGLLYAMAVFAGEYGVYALLTDPGSLPGGVFAVWIASWLWIPSGSLMVFSFLVFPDGHLPSPRWRFVAVLAGLAVCSVTASSALMPGALEGSPGSLQIGNPFGLRGAAAFLDALRTVFTPLLGAIALTSVAAVFLRFRQAEGDERQQLKWVAYAVVVLAVAVAASSFSTAVDRSLIGRMLFLVGFLLIPVAFGVALLRYRLWNIDLVINRTLVYGALTACVVGLYVLIVGYLGAVFQTRGSFAVSLVGAGVVAVLFAPLKVRLQRGVDRLMYGERDEPYAVVSRLGERLEAALAPDAVLPAVVETVREALKLPYAAVALPRDGGFRVSAASGESPHASPADPLVLPLSYGGETVGRMLLAPRPGEGGFSAADRRLLSDLARHAGVAVNGVRAMNDLRRSREGLVLAREEERRRLRRDLHDELAPTLAALGLSAATVGELIPTDPEGATSANEKLRKTIRATVGDVRRLVYDLRPPALDELGLVGAINERAARLEAGDGGLRVTVGAPETLPPLPAAVEVAAYRVAQEALTNVSRHARAEACHVRLACPGDGVLEVEVKDDGVGLPEGPQGGFGLRSMRERAEELGGTCEIWAATPSGTRVFARLPIAGPPAAPPTEERG